MKITLLPSAAGAQSGQYLTSFLVNDHVAIDAGSLGLYQEAVQQAAVRHIFLSHSHLDHLASLPIFLDNVIGINQAPVIVHATESVQQCLRLDVFNDRLWPNFLDLTVNGQPIVKLATIQSGRSEEVEGLRITPMAVDHVAPTLGFIIEDEAAAIVVSTDTGPTEEIWTVARKTPNLKAVFLDASFPDAMAELAKVSSHLTPAGFIREMEKVPPPVRFFAVHLKARFRDQVAQELLTHNVSRLAIAKIGVTYEF